MTQTHTDITIGRAVWYRSKSGDYTMPAVVAATTKTLHRGNVEAGYLPDLSSDSHVHLVVYTAGTPGQRNPATDPSLGRANPPGGGTFQEWDIPFWDANTGSQAKVLAEQPGGTWTWPPHY